jgi:hypothetical protein
VKYQVLTAESMKIIAFWDIATSATFSLDPNACLSKSE